MAILQSILVIIITLPIAILTSYASIYGLNLYKSSNDTYAKQYTKAQNYLFMTYLSPTPSTTPTPIPTKPPVILNPTTVESNNEWGVAKQIDEHTYTIKIGYSDTMATSNEIHQSLNNYRQNHGKSSLNWDQTLADYAQTRAELFSSIQKTDSHAGFNSFLENEDGFSKLGANQVGENSYYGGNITGVQAIEWVFAQSPGHDANQLSDQWTHVGIGVSSSGIDLIFATK